MNEPNRGDEDANEVGGIYFVPCLIAQVPLNSTVKRSLVYTVTLVCKEYTYVLPLHPAFLSTTHRADSAFGFSLVFLCSNVVINDFGSDLQSTKVFIRQRVKNFWDH